MLLLFLPKLPTKSSPIIPLLILMFNRLKVVWLCKTTKGKRHIADRLTGAWGKNYDDVFK